MPEISANFIHSLLFYAFGISSIVFALGVVFLPKIIHSAISMIIAFVMVACIFILLNSDFIGLAQIMIYATAVSILFLFAIMLFKEERLSDFAQVFSLKKVFAFCAVILFFISSLFSFTNGFGMFDRVVNIFTNQIDLVNLGIEFKDAVCIKLLGINILSHYLFVFELLSVLIIVVILGIATMVSKDKNFRISPITKGENKDDI